MRGNAVRLWGQQSSPNELLAGGENKFELHVHGSRTQIDVAGTLPGATVIEGTDLAVAARGQNLRDLFDLIGVAVPDTRAYRLRAHLMKNGDDYRFTRLVGSYGNSDLSGALTVTIPANPDERMFLKADLARAMSTSSISGHSSATSPISWQHRAQRPRPPRSMHATGFLISFRTRRSASMPSGDSMPRSITGSPRSSSPSSPFRTSCLVST